MRLDHLLSGKLHISSLLKRSHLSVVGREVAGGLGSTDSGFGGGQLGSVAQLVRAPS